MSISSAFEELVEGVRELGIGEYFDGLGENETIVLGLYRWEKYLEANIETIKEDMKDI